MLRCTETKELARSVKSGFRSSSAVQVGLLLLCSLEQELYQGPNVDEEGVHKRAFEDSKKERAAHGEMAREDKEIPIPQPGHRKYRCCRCLLDESRILRTKIPE